MGLDMYLTGKIYLGYKDENPIKQKIKDLVKTEFSPDYVEVELGYWRKANHIHKWFVDNVQNGKDDCETYYVSTSQLRELLNDVNDALVSTQPGNILPTQSGFFFGSTEYDENYLQDLKDTREILEKVLESKEDFEIYYNSSW